MLIKFQYKAQKKIATMNNIHSAIEYFLTKWAARSVQSLKRKAASMKKSGPGRKTSHLERNIGMKVIQSGGVFNVAVGTGAEVGKESVVYARILDVGGEIHPRRAKYLTIPMGDVKGRAKNFPFLQCARIGGKLFLVKKERRGGFIPYFFLTPRVTIPAFRWFSAIMEEKEKELNEGLKKENILKIAEKMAGGA